jgi:hypothetical protein
MPCRGCLASRASAVGTVCLLSRVSRTPRPASLGPSPCLLLHHAYAPPNMALEATGHSVRFLAGVRLYPVARASAWAFGPSCVWYDLDTQPKVG